MLDLGCPGTSAAAFERQSKRNKIVDTENMQEFDNLSVEHCHLIETRHCLWPGEQLLEFSSN